MQNFPKTIAMLRAQIFLVTIIWSHLPDLSAGNPKKGKALYKMHCMACHHLKKLVVGPSLIEITHIYKGKPNDIVKWSMNPGQKRKNSLRMPPMAHVGEKGLGDIAAYFFKATKGKTFRGNKSKPDPYSAFPKPKIQRMFMPDAGPAAIAVSLNENLHLCWDAGSCQLRYAWSGNYIDPWPVLKGNGNGLTIIKGEKFLKLRQGNSFNLNASIKFKGYKKRRGQPIFNFEVDQQPVTVNFEAVSDKQLKVHYKCSFNFNFSFTPQISLGSWVADKGKMKNGTLHLTPQEGQHFTITYKAGEDS